MGNSSNKNSEYKMTELIERYISRQQYQADGGPMQRVVPEIDAFLADIFKVFEKHGMSISHEDHHGGFEIENSKEDNKYNKNWLNYASDAREVSDPSVGYK